MVGIPGGGGGSRVDYTGPDQPTNPEVNEVWLDTDADPDGDGTAQGAYKRYGNDGEWHLTSVDDHDELKGVLEDSHHPFPIETAGIVDGAVTAAKAAFDYVTPTEFQNHTGDESNPHNVDDSQTGAASALNNHASNSGAHHQKPTDVTDYAASWVLVADETYTISDGDDTFTYNPPGDSITSTLVERVDTNAVDGDFTVSLSKGYSETRTVSENTITPVHTPGSPDQISVDYNYGGGGVEIQHKIWVLQIQHGHTLS